MGMILLVLAAIWLFVVPCVILARLTVIEDTLREKFAEAERRMKQQFEQLRLETERMAASQPPSREEPEAVPSVETELRDEQAPEEAPVVSASSAYDMSRDYEAVSAAEPAPEAEPVGAELLEADEAEPLTSAYGSVIPPEPEGEILHEPVSEPTYAPSYSAPVMEEQEPGVIALAFQKFYSWLLTEGNIWVCAGVLLFLVGFGLLFNYAIQRGVITLEMRLAAAAVTGLAMTWFGFRLRERRRAYAMILQGGGMGVLYLVVLAAAKLPIVQPILPPKFAIAAMLVMSVFTVLLALLQDYQPLAIFAILGGFAAPIIVSTGSRNYVALFSIYTLLNFEILALSFKRDWRLLSRMGFILTVSIGTAWGVRDWRPEMFSSVEPFLLIFLATYTLIASAVFSGARAPDLLLAVSAAFGFFFLQMKAAGHLQYGMSLTCLGLGLWHLLFGAWLRRKRQDDSGRTRLTLSNLYMFMCLLFSNLIAAYTFDNSTASAIWAVEGAFLTAAAYRTGSYKALLAGLALHAAALPFFCRELYYLTWNVTAGLSPIFVSGTLFALSLLCSGFCASRFRPVSSSDENNSLYDKWEEALQKILGEDGGWVRDGLSWILTILGSLCWWVTLYDQAAWLGAAWFSVFAAACATALAGSWLSARFNWKAGRFLLAWPITVAFFHALYLVLEQYPAALFLLRDFGEFAMLWAGGSMRVYVETYMYVVCIGGSLYLLRKAEKTVLSPFTMLAALLAGLFLTESSILYVSYFNFPRWGTLLSALPLLALLLCLRRFRRSVRREDAVPVTWAIGIYLCAQAWRFFISFWQSGITAENVFIPFLNPLELWQAFLLVSLFLWIDMFFMGSRKFREWPKLPKWIFGALVFAWINQMAIRASWHYWIVLPDVTQYYSLTETLRTAACQALIAIVWGVLGLGSILYGQKTRSRDLWYAGAGLIAADMVKLFLVDLNRSATLVRITAFLVLGGLALLIGWIAPLPPKKESDGHDY